jgi:hypothetical protein
MATSNFDGVPYTGVWVNWSHNLVQGTTLTLTKRNGGLLGAFLAIFITFAGGMFWRILSYALHQANTTDPSQKHDALHYQRQVILRNSGSGAGGVAWGMMKLAIAWRGKVANPFLRCLSFAFLAGLNVLLFGIAGIFTSEITSVPGNSTLILGSQCGGFKPATATLGADLGLWQSKILADTTDAATYVRQCYQNATSSSGNCGKFIRSSLPFTTNSTATCPFQAGLCMMSDRSAFSMDTGLMDSHEDFGINAPPEHRIKFRRVATCAPIHGTSFGSVINDTVLGNLLLVKAGPNPSTLYNSTFIYFTHSNLDGIGYTLR